MMFVKSIVAFILILLFIPGITFSQENEQLFVEVLTSAGAELELMDIVDWTELNGEYMDFEQLEKYRNGILEIFEVKEKFFDVTKENSDMHRILSTRVLLDSDTYLHIILQSLRMPEEYEIEPQTYLVVNVSGKNFDKYAEYGQKVQEAVLSFGGETKITSCITGTFNGKLDEVKQEQILENIYACLKISDKQILKDEYAFSLMGYSPLFAKGIEIFNKSYNVNIAMRYNEEDDRTYIWLGTPVISLEY